MPKKNKNNISESTLQRISDYLCVLNYLKEQGVETISSRILSKMMNISDSQIRKDLSYFGSFGKKGVGYNVDEFIEAIEGIMNLSEVHRVCIIGMGRLGTALIKYKRMRQTPFNIVAGFDNDPNKIGTTVNNIEIYDIDKIKDISSRLKCEIAILTVPSYVVHEIYAKISGTCIKALLNFTPIILTGGNGLLVRNMDFVSELKIISYYLKEKQ
ncbi:MAG: redox-sensing transcriptional repressor Rex [candidate division WOR-3 bacterium]|nr:redox-sensing transcriptional repressor Rex [candidate division WOR-3 bacterium]